MVHIEEVDPWYDQELETIYENWKSLEEEYAKFTHEELCILFTVIIIQSNFLK